MAMQAESPAGTPSAQTVGNAFVEQYYHILHKSPELVYRFYQDSSVLSRPGSDGVMTSVMTMQGINEKILSLDYKDYIAEIKTADAQQSFGKGVIVLVTGYLTGSDSVRKKFAQTFFLAPQETNGWFVLNDVFRYVEDDASVNTIQVSTEGVSENVQTASPPPEPEQQSHGPDHPGQVLESPIGQDLNDKAEVCDPSENEDDGSITEEEIVDPLTHVNKNDDAAVALAPSASQEDAPKISYASILKAKKATPSPVAAKPPASNVRAKPPSSDREAISSGKIAPVTEVSASTSENAPENNNIVEEAEGHSIYIRNLAQNATPAQLEEVFAKFGPIKQGGVQVRSNKQGQCFGFVEFESLSSTRSAIEASPIVIGNRKAVIEEKRTKTRVSTGLSTNSGRGRFPSSRGGFRGESFRGRGNFGGGRGYGRGEFSGRPRGSAGRGVEGYQRVDQNGGRQGAPK